MKDITPLQISILELYFRIRNTEDPEALAKILDCKPKDVASAVQDLLSEGLLVSAMDVSPAALNLLGYTHTFHVDLIGIPDRKSEYEHVFPEARDKISLIACLHRVLRQQEEQFGMVLGPIAVVHDNRADAQFSLCAKNTQAILSVKVHLLTLLPGLTISWRTLIPTK